MQLMKYLMQEIIMMIGRGQGIRRLASAFDLLCTVAQHLISLMSLDQVTTLGVPSTSFEELFFQALILNL
jgi:hypothetical protein